MTSPEPDTTSLQARDTVHAVDDVLAIAAHPADLAFLDAAPHWQALRAEQVSQPWSDDFSNIFGAIRW